MCCLTKYRTRQTRAKAALKKKLKWETLSETERTQCFKEIVAEIDIQRETELQAAAKEWIQLAYGGEVIEELEQKEDKSESLDDSDIEEWNDIQDSDGDTTWDGIQTSIEECEESYNEEASEDANVDVSDHEKFLDENGNEIEPCIIVEGLKEIWQRHWQNLEKSMELWVKLDERE